MDEKDKGKSLDVLSKEIAQSWHALSESEKEKYRDDFRKDQSEWRKLTPEN